MLSYNTHVGEGVGNKSSSVLLVMGIEWHSQVTLLLSIKISNIYAFDLTTLLP